MICEWTATEDKMGFVLTNALQQAKESVFDVHSANSNTILRNIQALIAVVTFIAKDNNTLNGKFGSVAKQCYQFFDDKQYEGKYSPFSLANGLMALGVEDLRLGGEAFYLHWRVWRDYCHKGGVGAIDYKQAKQWANDLGLTERLKETVDYMHKFRSLVRSFSNNLPINFPHHDEIKAILKRFLELFSYELFFSQPRY